MMGELPLKRPIPRAMVIGALALLLTTAFLDGSRAVQRQLPAASLGLGRAGSLVAVSSELTATIYLPYVARKYPMLTVFGAETAPLSLGGGLDRMASAGSTWTRWSQLWWPDFELTKGSVSQAALTALDVQLSSASALDMQVILSVKGTPAWAQARPPYACGPIKEEEFASFGGFVQTLVSRYSVAPYNVKYWEIGNEPDIAPPDAFPPDSPYGCWGDASDDYYGGGHYGNMLKVVYPAIKAADPQSQVLVGGLLLDCDPAVSDCKDGREKPSLFLEGILHAGGGEYFDGVSFHGYDYYSGTVGSYYNPNWQSAWNTTGPVGIAKAHFLEGVLSAHGVTGKFLMNTEAAILCPSCSSDATFETTKAYYVAQAYATAIAEGWRANLWYSVLGWRNSGLLNADLSPKPAYDAFRAARGELRDAQLVREIVDYVGVKGYAFDRGDRQLWMLWSMDGSDHEVLLPFTPRAAFDVLGGSVAVSSTMMVTLAPVYLEP
jgi:hypothetical protein